jgi:nucleotide-binding universal stress UspA family protein
MRTDSDVFDRVVCGADGSEPGAAAADLAARVTAPDGTLVLVTVDDPSIAVHAGWAMSRVAEQLAHEAIAASERAQSTVQVARPIQVETRLLEGHPLDCLRREIDRVDATLAVVGTRGRSRAVGITLGSVTTHLLHEAACSVLVARPPREPDAWPKTIVVGVDGSAGSATALRAARELGDRVRAEVRALVATREPHVDLDAARELAPDLEEVDDRVLHALHDVSEDADLLVVGNRGLRGIRALGSVGERIAHEAVCPVLVVRESGG